METRFQYSGETFIQRAMDKDAKVLEETNCSRSETHQEMALRIQKEYTANNVLSVLNIIQKHFGEETSDGLAMQLADFLESDQKPREFTIAYLESMENKARRYLLLQRKLLAYRIKPIRKTAMSSFTAKGEVSKPLPTKNQGQESLVPSATDYLLNALHMISSTLIIKQNELYHLLEAICKNTYDKTYSIDMLGYKRDPRFAQRYARILMFPAMEEGLPYSIPVKLINYIKEHGIGNVDAQLKCAFGLVDEINELRGVVSKKSTELLSQEEIQKEATPYASDSSSVFTGDLIPVPINKQSMRGTVDMPREAFIS